MKKLTITICSLALMASSAFAQQSMEPFAQNTKTQNPESFALLGGSSNTTAEKPADRHDIIIDSSVARSMNSNDADPFVGFIQPQIFPNPSRGLFKVRFPSDEKILSIVIYDMHGTPIQVKDPNKMDTPLDLEMDLVGENAGTYIIVFRTEKNTYTQRLVLVK